MKNKVVTIIIILYLSINCYSELSSTETKISGKISGTFRNKTLHVTDKLVVEMDQDLNFEDSTVILLDEYCRIEVYGRLKINNNVVLKSSSDSLDWNGITIFQSGYAEVRNTSIKNSIFGFIIPDSSFLILENVFFEKCDFPLKIGEKEIHFREKMPVNFKKNIEISVKTDVMNLKKEKIFQYNVLPVERDYKILVYRYLSLVSALGSSAFYINYRIKTEKYTIISEKEPDKQLALTYKKDIDTYKKNAKLSGILALISLSTVLFTIQIPDFK